MYIYRKINIYIYRYGYALNLLIEHSGNNLLCSFTTPQAFWQSSAPGALSTLVTSVVTLTLMSPGKDETH